MDAVTEMRRSLEDFESNFDTYVIDAAMVNKSLIEKMNKEQIYDGVRSDGTPIEPLYTKFTRKVKREKEQPTNRVTLKDEGDFHDAIYSERFDNEILNHSYDVKTNKLVDKYGKEIFGLTEHNIGVLSQITEGPLIEIARLEILN